MGLVTPFMFTLTEIVLKKKTFRIRESLNKHLPLFGFNGRGTSHHCVNF